MNLRTPITLLILLVILLGAAYFGWQTVVSPGDDGKDDTADPSTDRTTCAKRQVFKKGERFRTADIRINVYNAGSRRGLAGDTLEDLSKQGFKAGVADNAPDGVTARNVTVLTEMPRSPQVRLVIEQFRGKVRLATGRSLAPGIDVAVGDDFVGVDQQASEVLRLRKPVTTCRQRATG